jgi:signal transduction histidine kinase
MAQGGVAVGPFALVTDGLSRAAGVASRKVRLTVALSVLLIAGSFASAAIIQMRLDRAHALDQAAAFETVRAREIASDLSLTLDRYAALGSAFANSAGEPDTSAALSEAAGPALRNVAVLDANGELMSELKSVPSGFLPLEPRVLAAALHGRAVALSADGRSLIAAFASQGRIVALQLDASALLPPAGMEGAVVADPDGRVLVLGAQWSEVPPAASLTLSGGAPATRTIKLDNENRLVALAPAPHWPIAAGSSVDAGAALDAWYGSLPLYLFFILGPALAGAGLAVIFVREFERRARTAEAVKSLRSTRPEDARLLVRLADAERRAVESERSKSEFIAHMSHELRTPLNAIIGFSEVIERGFFGAPGHPKYVEYAHDIGSAGRSLHAKIGDILEFANLEAGRYPLDPETIDLAAVARETVDELAGRAFSRRIRLTVSLPESAPARADGHAAKRILTNILSNALQYTPQGGSVRVQVREEEGAVVASIRDSGKGFAPEEARKAGQAFMRFNRANAETGAGMGLAIAMALARRMGGAVSLAGAPGQGTLAELRLPKA